MTNFADMTLRLKYVAIWALTVALAGGSGIVASARSEAPQGGGTQTTQVDSRQQARQAKAQKKAQEKAQKKEDKAKQRAQEAQEKAQAQIQREVGAGTSGRVLMPYFIENGDTVYYDTVPPTWVFANGPSMSRSDWRQYYRLVYNFNKVYPYAKMASRIVAEADSTIEARGMNRIQKEKYIDGWESELLTEFEPVVRKMTISQGQLLVRLVDREIGKTTYSILKDYTNRITAGFWQGIGKLFGQDLKNHYDPEGEDARTEDLIRKWESGEFDFLYFSIFMEQPPRTEIPSKYQ